MTSQIKQAMHSCFVRLKSFRTILLCICFSYVLPLHPNCDLSIVGFLEPEGGLGKLPITILETLDDDISVNFVPTSIHKKGFKYAIPNRVENVLNNPDTSPGKVALLTDIIIDKARQPFNDIPKECIVKLAYTMFETTKIPDMWVKTLNEEFDAIIVPDKYLVEIYENCGVSIPIFVLPIPMMLDSYNNHPTHPKKPSTPFVFGDSSANKNPGILVEAFAKAFGNNPNIQLVMRAGHISTDVRAIIDRKVEEFGLKNVIVEDGQLVLAQYMERLFSYDCYINLSRGEGFSFIPRESLALGVPVIITDNTASKTICESGLVRAVESNKKGSANPSYKTLFNEQCGMQFDCEVEDVVEALRDVYSHYSKYIKKARKGREWVQQYNSADPNLKELYRTMIRPKQVVMGKNNSLKNGILTTNSPALYKKYQKVIGE